MLSDPATASVCKEWCMSPQPTRTQHVMQELVEEGKYKVTEEGWVRADADDDEAAAADEVTRYYRYFHDQPEKADTEQMANAEEMLRFLTYSAGWQGLDGPPDAGSRPFDHWDGVGPHWRGDARRGEEARGEHGAVAGEGADAAAMPEQEPEEVGEGMAREAGPEERKAEMLADIAAMTKEEALNSVQAIGENEDFSDDVKYPPVAMERIGEPMAEGQGRRDGLVFEPWREVIDVVLDADQPGPEDPEEVREQGTHLVEALRRIRAAREAAVAGEELPAEAVAEEEEVAQEVPPEEAEAMQAEIGRVPWTTPYDDVRCPSCLPLYQCSLDGGCCFHGIQAKASSCLKLTPEISWVTD